MRKLTVLAMLAAVTLAGAAFARTNHTVQPNATFTFGVGGAAFGPTTTNNDDTCDIGNAPAATLLLPFFDVDIVSPQNVARTTLFTITNTSNLPQIAHVVVWTDWSFPVLDFNIYLTGYDVQPINLYDVIARGQIAPLTGTSSTTVSPANPSAGSQPACGSVANGNPCATGAPVPVNLATGNPNITSLAGCGALPGPIPAALLACVRSGLTTGLYPCSCGATPVGGVHADAIGYITVDVNANCNTNLPSTSGGVYFTTNILYDNVLIGDYENIQPNPAVVNAAGGATMVAIRAVPEGGAVGSSGLMAPPTNLPDTFYDRYTFGTALDRRYDRRQPLPSTFAARYIQGGTGSFNTNYQIWREGITNPSACTGANINSSSNSALSITEIVRFDEHENATLITPNVVISPQPTAVLATPETSSQPTGGALFPPIPTAASDIAGWMYLNLHNGGAAVYSRDGGTAAGAPNFIGFRASQNWVTVNLVAESRFSVLFDAAWLGNGCSTPTAAAAQVGPWGVAPGTTGPPNGGVLVCPPAPATCNAPPASSNTTPP